MTPNWDAIGALAELVGAIGVVASLLYLSSQIRQNNALARRGAAQSHLAARAELNRFIASDPELVRLFWNGLENLEALTEDERKRFQNLISTAVRHYEALFLDHCEGLLPERVWRAQAVSGKRWMTQPGARWFIAEHAGELDPEFVAFVSEGDAP